MSAPRATASARRFAPYLAGDDGSTGFPAIRRRGPAALISLSSAVPTLPLMATGTLGRDQLAALATVLEQLAAEDVFRVLLVHHPLKSKAWQKRLTDSAALLALLKRHGVELVLQGHDHIHSTMWFEGPNGNIPAIGVPSASALAHGRYPAAAYNLFTIEKDNAGWRCEQVVRGLGAGLQIGQIKHTNVRCSERYDCVAVDAFRDSASVAIGFPDCAALHPGYEGCLTSSARPQAGRCRTGRRHRG